jgi:hypothetical protein
MGDEDNDDEDVDDDDYMSKIVSSDEGTFTYQ